MTPVCQQGFLYGGFGEGDHKGQRKCRDLATGQQMWAVKGLGWAGTILVHDHLLVLQEACQLVLVTAPPQAYVEMAQHQAVNGHFFFSSRGRHTRYIGDWSSDVCSSDLR